MHRQLTAVPQISMGRQPRHSRWRAAWTVAWLLLVAGCSGCRKDSAVNQPAPGSPAEVELSEVSDELWELNIRGVGYMEQFDIKSPGGTGFQRAVETFEELTRRWPNWSPGRFNLAVALINDGSNPDKRIENLSRAKTLLQEILARNADDARAHYTLGFVLHFEGDFDAARPHFELLCTRLAPTDAHSWMRLGDCLQDSAEPGQTQQPEGTVKFTAFQCYERALELDPYLAPALYKLSQGLRRAESGLLQRAQDASERFNEMKRTVHYHEYANDYIWSGPLAEVIGARVPAARPDASPLPLYAVEEQAQFILAENARWATDADWQAAPHVRLLARVRKRFGAGVAAFDYDKDGKLDLLLLNSAVVDGQLRDTLFHNEGSGRFVDVTAEAGLAAARTSIGCAVGDFDAGGFVDLYISAAGSNVLFRNAGRSGFEDVTLQAGVAEAGIVSLSAYFLDVDHDSDLDLLVANYGPLSDEDRMFTENVYDGGAANALFINVGKARLEDPTSKLLPPLEVAFAKLQQPSDVWGHVAPTVGFAAADFDDDRDLDLVQICDASPCRMLINRRFDNWDAASVPDQLVPPRTYNGALVGDFNCDTHVDLLIISPDGPTIALENRTQNGAIDQSPAFEPLPTDLVQLRSAQLLDVDFDGWPDLVGLSAAGDSPVLGANRARGIISNPEWISPLLQDWPELHAVLAADFEGNGWQQVLVVHIGQAPTLLATSGNGNHWIALSVTGRREQNFDTTKKKLRSNPDGIGTRAIVHAGRASVAFEYTSRSAGLCQSLTPLPLGLFNRDRVDVVRLRWPDGVEQAELNLPVDQTHIIEELQRRDSSCPLLFAWNGQRFEFVTDFLGGGGIGYLVAPGEYAQPDPDEDVKIEPHQLAPSEQGRYVFKIAEPMDEMTYLDAALLEVVDHPAELSVYPDERFDPQSPHPAGSRLVFRDRIFPVAARDHRGQDVLEKLMAWDRQTVDGFRCSAMWIGYAEEHFVELDFGRAFAGLDVDDPVALFLAGWVEYPYSQTNWAAATAGVRLEPPVLEWCDGDGRWQPLVENMGYPAGLPRMMTLDLTGKLPSAVLDRNDPLPCRLRIRTNMEIYWDQIFAARLEPESLLRRSVLEPVEARLRYRGGLQEYSPDGLSPLLFDYHRPIAIPLVGLKGVRTPYGDVRHLVSHQDDDFVLINAGDEVTLAYDSSSLPALPDRWTRSFILQATGYCKDTDLFNPSGRTVEPMPRTRR